LIFQNDSVRKMEITLNGQMPNLISTHFLR
jgi:hypothetical protein